MLKAIRMLGDGHLERMTETRLLGDYVLPVFDPQSTTGCDGGVEETASIPSSWSRVASRAALCLIHKGGLNYAGLYPRLYRLLDDSLLECPEAGRFLTDLDLYLSSLWVAFCCIA